MKEIISTKSSYFSSTKKTTLTYDAGTQRTEDKLLHTEDNFKAILSKDGLPLFVYLKNGNEEFVYATYQNDIPLINLQKNEATLINKTGYFSVYFNETYNKPVIKIHTNKDTIIVKNIKNINNIQNSKDISELKLNDTNQINNPIVKLKHPSLLKVHEEQQKLQDEQNKNIKTENEEFDVIISADGSSLFTRNIHSEKQAQNNYIKWELVKI